MDSIANEQNYKVTDKKTIIKLKDPGSAITHSIAMFLCIIGGGPLLSKAAEQSNRINLISLGIYILSMTLLYFASTTYHSINSSKTVNLRLRKMDHMMIFIMIAGGYTPICLIEMHNTEGYFIDKENNYG